MHSPIEALLPLATDFPLRRATSDPAPDQGRRRDESWVCRSSEDAYRSCAGCGACQCTRRGTQIMGLSCRTASIVGIVARPVTRREEHEESEARRSRYCLRGCQAKTVALVMASRTVDGSVCVAEARGGRLGRSRDKPASFCQRVAATAFRSRE